MSSTLSAIKDKAADAERRTAEHGLLHGVARTAAEEVKDLAGELTDKASDAVLYEQLHGKIAGCYEEPARGLASLRLNVQSVRLRELQVVSRPRRAAAAGAPPPHGPARLGRVLRAGPRTLSARPLKLEPKGRPSGRRFLAPRE